MILKPFITKQYETVFLHQKMTDVLPLFKSWLFFIVIDETSSPVGLISYYDFLINQNGLVKDCNLDKPRLDTNDSIIDALNLITSWGSCALPVYSGHQFVGVVTQSDLICTIVKKYQEYKEVERTVIPQLRSSIANILGLISPLETDVNERQRKEILELANKTCKDSISIINDLQIK